MTYQNPTSTSNQSSSTQGTGVRESIRDYREQASELGQAALERARDAAPQARRMARRASSSMQETVRDYPVTSLVTTATVAFVLGALWQGGSRRRMFDGWSNRSRLESWMDSLQNYAEPGLRALSREHSRWR
jgi:ElaB/YqjD/DUF883 family membrane-anchored ribosome-binding protein